MRVLGVTVVSFAVVVMFINPSLADGITNNIQNVSEWHSEIEWGILEQEKTKHVELKIKTLSENAVELTWTTDVPEKISSYQILKKTKNSDYTAFEMTKQTSYVDTDLESGNYYGYKVIPIFKKQELDPVTKHGIDRQNKMHYAYKKVQELLAMQTAMQKYPKYYDEPFIEINNIKWHEFSETDRRDNLIFQKRILEEAIRAEKTFSAKTLENR